VLPEVPQAVADGDDVRFLGGGAVMKPYGFRPGFWSEVEIREAEGIGARHRSFSRNNVREFRSPRHAARHRAKLEVSTLAADTSQCPCEFCEGAPYDNSYFAPWCECDPWDSPGYDACTNCWVRGCGRMAQTMAEAPAVPTFTLADAAKCVTPKTWERLLYVASGLAEADRRIDQMRAR
jgi:hypothetical protein